MSFALRSVIRERRKNVTVSRISTLYAIEKDVLRFCSTSSSSSAAFDAGSSLERAKENVKNKSPATQTRPAAAPSSAIQP